MVRRQDSVDLACQSWAAVKRELLGLAEPALSRGFLGPMRCTLGARRDLHHGGRSERVDQHFPEFPFRPGTDEYCVNLAFWRMPESLAEIMVAHYVVIEPRSRRVRADLMGLSPVEYYHRIARARDFVRGVLSVYTQQPEIRGIYGTTSNAGIS